MRADHRSSPTMESDCAIAKEWLFPFRYDILNLVSQEKVSDTSSPPKIHLVFKPIVDTVPTAFEDHRKVVRAQRISRAQDRKLLSRQDHRCEIRFCKNFEGEIVRLAIA